MRREDVRLSELKWLVRGGGGRFTLKAEGTGFGLTVLYKGTSYELQRSRGEQRLFKTLDTAAAYVRDEFNITKLTVITDDWKRR